MGSFVSTNRLRFQSGAGNTLVYLAMAVLVAAAAAVAVYLVSQSGADDDLTTAEEHQERLLSAAPPEERPVDFQDTQIERPVTRPQTKPDSADDTSDLFAREGKKLPLTDGLAGGREAEPASTSSPSPAPRVNAVDAFDYGVLDGRVRIGVFGKAAIPDYRVRVRGQTYVIEMPGEFRYVEEFGRTLNIDRFGVASARLERDARGMRMTIQATAGLKHEPFLIEDPRGLMVAFEPRQ